jgi:branched-chain amino acid aminotransferase
LNYVNLNGKIATASDTIIPVDNGAFRYGYGLFETMLVRDGAIRLMDYHWDRLFDGAKQLYFDLPALVTSEYLENEVLRTVRKNNLEKLCRVRLQLFAPGGGLYSHEKNIPGFLIECFPLDESTLGLNENGLVVGIATGIAKSIDSLSNLKSCNALIYAVAAQQAKAHKWNDALICNTNVRFIESTIANIFWIKDDIVYTPPLSDGCVAGVMRRHILDEIPVKEMSLTIGALLDADEVFLTNSIKPIRWVREISETQYGNTRTQAIHRHIS